MRIISTYISQSDNKPDKSHWIHPVFSLGFIALFPALSTRFPTRNVQRITAVSSLNTLSEPCQTVSYFREKTGGIPGDFERFLPGKNYIRFLIFTYHEVKGIYPTPPFTQTKNRLGNKEFYGIFVCFVYSNCFSFIIHFT